MNVTGRQRKNKLEAKATDSDACTKDPEPKTGRDTRNDSLDTETPGISTLHNLEFAMPRLPHVFGSHLGQVGLGLLGIQWPRASFRL
jgi:hypothetical protein